MCLVCNKTRSHVMHEGQGVAEPEAEQDEEEQALSVHHNHEEERLQSEVAYTMPPPENYFRIESNGSNTQIEISIPEGDRSIILQALLEFMERIKEVQVVQILEPEPKKGNK